MEIRSIEIYTNDLNGTKVFYGDLLQFPVLSATATGISFLIGHSELKFILDTTLQPFYHFAFSIPNNHLDEALAWFSQRTAILPVNNEPIANFQSWNAKAFYFYDNNGNILECITHFDQASVTEGNFSTALITGIAEIGIVTDAVINVCEELYINYRVPYFSKGPRLADFTVMGDEDGLLIVALDKRGWWPTMQAAEKHYVKTMIVNGGIDHTFIFNAS